jgi:hypothetical protein
LAALVGVRAAHEPTMVRWRYSCPTTLRGLSGRTAALCS